MEEVEIDAEDARIGAAKFKDLRDRGGEKLGVHRRANAIAAKKQVTGEGAGFVGVQREGGSIGAVQQAGYTTYSTVGFDRRDLP